MEESLEANVEDTKAEKKYFRIFGITVWRIFAYFIIYSIIGFIIETLFGIARYRCIRK